MDLETQGFKTPTNSRHSSYLLAWWAKEQREDFGLSRKDEEGRESRETTPGLQKEATAEWLVLKGSSQP